MKQNEKEEILKENIKNEIAPWYKKRISIIAFISLIFAAVLIIGITVPITLKNAYDTETRINKITNVYDRNMGWPSNVKLYVDGSNLSYNKQLYRIFNVTLPTEKYEISQNSFSLIPFSKSEITFAFNDNFSSDVPVYQVMCNYSGSNWIEMNSTNNILQPYVRIDRQPISQTINSSSTNKNAILSVTTTVTNPIIREYISYQWMTSNKTGNDVIWVEISGANSNSCVFVPNNGFVGTKYFKCIMKYKYAKQIQTHEISVIWRN